MVTITMHTLQPRCQIPQLPTGEEAGYTELCPPPSWASLCLNHSGSALSKERSRSLQQPLARSPTFLMTTGIIQRERVKTHPKVWRGKAFHPACGLCVLCNKLPSHSFGCSPRLHLAHMTQKDQPRSRGIAQELAQDSLLLSCHRMAHCGWSPLYFARC